jgi:hypothetical protein
MKPGKEAVLEALKAFQAIYSKGGEDEEFKRSWKFRPEDMTRMQQAFNRYLSLNKAYHGCYVSSNSSDFLK